MSETEFGLSIASLIGLVILFLVNKFKPEGIKDLKNSFFTFKDDIIQRIVKLETVQNIYVEQLKDHLVDAIHSPNHPEIDRLLEKMKAKTITKEEVCELRDKLKAAMIKFGKESSKYLATGHLLAIIESEIPVWK